MKLGALLLLMLVGISAFFYFGGNAEKPDNVPSPDVPSTNEAAGHTTNFFNWFGDFIMTINSQAWIILIILALTGLFVWMFRQVPLSVWLILAVVALVIVVVV